MQQLESVQDWRGCLSDSNCVIDMVGAPAAVNSIAKCTIAALVPAICQDAERTWLDMSRFDGYALQGGPGQVGFESSAAATPGQ